MNIKNLLAILTLMAFITCNTQKKEDSTTDKDKDFYTNMKKNVEAEPDSNFMDSTNVFDENYIPSHENFNKLLVDMGREYRVDSTMIVKFDIRTPEQLNGAEPMDTLIIGDETFTRNLHDITESEIQSLRYNLNMAKQTKENPAEDGGCKGKDCMVYTHVNKKEQKLYLYLNGELLDTFDTSTARKGYTTPDFSRKPDGRMFRKYSSHKYPGGSWNGLGNMPYAVFIEGGYAIHGATSGEIRQLGNPASHGCIRIHPKNAKIYYNLVKYAGAENTWVDVTEN